MLFVAPIAGEPRGRSVRGSVVGELVGFDDTFGRGAAVIREVCDLGEEIDGGGWIGVHGFFAWWCLVVGVMALGLFPFLGITSEV